MVTKGFPWYDPTLLNETVVAGLAANGYNVIRLGLMWTGAEPSKGAFNTTYYSIVKSTIALLARYDIYTLLDMHQDCLSTLFCLYDGAPLWVIEKSKPRHAFPWPAHGPCGSRPWAANELTEAAGQAYQDIYDNTSGMLDDLVSFWSYSASYFRTSPILGYEIINEPFAGDIFKDPALLLPGEAGRRNLLPMYDRVAAAIRAQDPVHLIFYEPVTWGMVLNNKVLGSGFTRVPGGIAYANTSVFSFHYYCWIMTPNASTFIHTACDAGLAPQVFKSVYGDVERTGGSSFLTEFGADTCMSVTHNSTECAAVIEESTETFQSWIHWPDSEGRSPRDMGLTRPYARAIAGRPLSASFKCTNNSGPAPAGSGREPVQASVGQPCRQWTYSLCYAIDAALVAPTEIWVDFEGYYPHGATLSSTQSLVAVRSGNVVLVHAAQPGVQGLTGCVTIH